MLLTAADQDRRRWCGVTVPTAGRVSLCAPYSTHRGHEATARHSHGTAAVCIAVLTLRRLMSYIYGAPILDVSRSHTTTQQSVGLLWTSDQLVAETST